ncbi:hypothetical protein [Anaerolentibacter hominis]|uniref:hypothetical protein n=1 Tax=Anaerolentibacter hominis TaxID=3079009 RepID=UPI0031B8784E
MKRTYIAVLGALACLALLVTILLVTADTDSAQQDQAVLPEPIPAPATPLGNANEEINEADQDQELPEGAYYIRMQDGFVTVFYSDGNTIYEETGIRVDTLPLQEQEKIKAGFSVSSEEELYSILETYSS